MNYLLDTHILLWSFLNPGKLSENVKRRILDIDNSIYYSPMNLLEISIKYGLKKLYLNDLTPEEFFDEVKNSFLQCKRMDNFTAISNYNLPLHHKDPFDRFLIWEAIQSDFTLLTVDDSILQYMVDGLKTES